MPTRTDHDDRRRAFTLVEVLVVVAIIGIASAIVVPRMLEAGTLGVQGAARAVVSDVMFAQNEAIAHARTRQLEFDVAGNGYSVLDESDNVLTATWIDHTANNYRIDFDENQRFEGVELMAADFGGNDRLVFDDLGAPSSGGSVDLQYESHTFRVSVAPFTGRVTVERVTEVE
jgi:prepilin-type N-terminal cleavage/methylation domain-containing protein